MEYTITRVERRNEWSFQGSQMVDYAIAIQGEQGWIKLTTKVSTPPPREGDILFGQIENKQDKNGNAYRKFTKLQRGGTVAPVAGASPGLEKKLDYIIVMLEEITDRRPHHSVAEETKEPDPFEGLGL
jgi:hypothetical protein